MQGNKEMAAWIRWAIPLAVSFAISIGAWIGGYSVLQSDVAEMKQEWKEANIDVMKYKLETIMEQNKKLEKKLDTIIDLQLQKNNP